MANKNLKRVSLHSGCEDNMDRSIHGLFEVLIDQELLRRQMNAAYHNTGRKSTRGALVVVYRAATQAQAEYMVAHPPAEFQRAATPVQRETKEA